MKTEHWILLAIIGVVLFLGLSRKSYQLTTTGTVPKLHDTPMFAWMHTVLPKTRTTYMGANQSVGLPEHWHSQP